MGGNFSQGSVPGKALCGKYKIVTDHISVFALAAKKQKSQICDPSLALVKAIAFIGQTSLLASTESSNYLHTSF